MDLRERALKSRDPALGLEYLASQSPSSVRLGLDRVHAALALLGNPEARVPALHVAGTNGKGSTCAFAAACLGQRYRTGLYTSPHLVRVNERIKIDGADVADATLGRRVIEVLERLPAVHELTYFELGTVVALWHFAQERVQLAVLETGLGGRLDATSASHPLVTAITSISLDHTEYLGSSLAAIAGEKAGIVKRGVPLVSSAQEPEARGVLESAARAHAAPFLLEGRDFSCDGEAFQGVALKLSGLSPRLRGPHQRHNLAVALACLEQLGGRGFPLSTDELRTGVAEARWPGRLEELPGRPTIVLDGAHNPDGARALATALAALYPGRPLHLVFGVLADKDHGPMRRALFPRAAAVYLVPVASPRGLDPRTTLDEARALAPAVSVHPDAWSGLLAAREAAGDGVVVVAGSLFLVGQVRAALLAERAVDSGVSAVTLRPP